VHWADVYGIRSLAELDRAPGGRRFSTAGQSAELFASRIARITGGKQIGLIAAGAAMSHQGPLKLRTKRIMNVLDRDPPVARKEFQPRS